MARWADAKGAAIVATEGGKIDIAAVQAHIPNRLIEGGSFQLVAGQFHSLLAHPLHGSAAETLFKSPLQAAPGVEAALLQVREADV